MARQKDNESDEASLGDFLWVVIIGEYNVELKVIQGKTWSRYKEKFYLLHGLFDFTDFTDFSSFNRILCSFAVFFSFQFFFHFSSRTSFFFRYF